VDEFNAGIEPLRTAGKLGAILAQFPPSFENDAEGRQRLLTVLDTFNESPMAVELRHRSWSQDPSTQELLRSHNAAWVQTDEPRFSISSAEDLPLTADFAYFRFHGRNKEDWWSGNNETRYRYFIPMRSSVSWRPGCRLWHRSLWPFLPTSTTIGQGYAPKTRRI